MPFMLGRKHAVEDFNHDRDQKIIRQAGVGEGS